jgi:hypothetical protein
LVAQQEIFHFMCTRSLTNKQDRRLRVADPLFGLQRNKLSIANKEHKQAASCEVNRRGVDFKLCLPTNVWVAAGQTLVAAICGEAVARYREGLL